LTPKSHYTDAVQPLVSLPSNSKEKAVGFMNIHSKILVHWTGKKDIERDPVSTRMQKYIYRLQDYYQNGLFMKITAEPTTRFKQIKNLPRLCFTEIKLSQASDHAKKYGKLGIGFSREFILQRGGRPVIYIAFEPKDGLLERSLAQALDKSKGNDEIHKPMISVHSFIKRMWEEKGEKRVEHYDEMEWRIVRDNHPNYNQHFRKGKMVDEFRFQFAASDVKIIIFPDKKTMKASFDDKIIKEFFSKHTPIVVTLDECKNF
jgi:hypothetical protein